MKGATHNLVVRTRTDVALYVLNHKRGHLRDLENSLQGHACGDRRSDRERPAVVHHRSRRTGAYAGSRQGAAGGAGCGLPAAGRGSLRRRRAVRHRNRVEVETEETEGLADDAAGRRRRSDGETDADGHQAASGGGAGAAVPASRAKAARRATTSEIAARGVRGRRGRRLPTTSEADEDEGEEQPGVRSRRSGGQAASDGRARRGRRGGRRRRGGGPEDGLAGSIADELGPTPAPEATDAVADFDGGSPEPAPSLVEPEPVAPAAATAMAARGTCFAGNRKQRADARGNRAGGRPGRGAAALDRARKGLLS